ncbi:hypothetical protein ElyMa_005488600 [Elysia marginata]|uniref:Uncharacterized protein n=1 Tax=Elysia marginata TaxID=1093978 RepID=A0AAV4ESP5_9GAST|nr:hypothetical protein ElyMa_005488600 [Elysia marginata]
MRVTAGVTTCGQKRPLSNKCTRSLRQMPPGRREDPDPQQPVSANRTSECQDGHLNRTARWAEGTWFWVVLAFYSPLEPRLELNAVAVCLLPKNVSDLLPSSFPDDATYCFHSSCL